MYYNTRPISEPSRFYMLLSKLRGTKPSISRVSESDMATHVSMLVSPPSRGWMLLSLKAIRYTSHLTHNSLRWAGADTFLLTITSHTGPTFRLSGPLGFFFHSLPKEPPTNGSDPTGSRPPPRGQSH